ncbi:hypothetical protein [Nannocystis punicea]|uniref:Integral membrane protein n=1 Tax=Nannocystis punicea TaxID=2995304 RepID=A0ABY7GWZ1_9BACT|nr:hypothetical protein [Nannocystis poenicansa]WAS91458.1 hypothetical protein O0S08_35190 [Nannocystis poenicansa]
MDTSIITYTIYLGISLALTMWVARTLHKNGRIFLVDAMQGNEELADSVNHLLVVGFYLVNIGFVTLWLREYGAAPADARAVFEILSGKLGTVLLTLGGMHFFNMYVLARVRRRAELRTAPPPVHPSGLLQPPASPYHVAGAMRS